MLTENLAEKTFPLKSCMHGGIAQSVRSSSDSSSPISKPRIPRPRMLRLLADNPKAKVCNFEQKKFPGFL